MTGKLVTYLMTVMVYAWVLEQFIVPFPLTDDIWTINHMITNERICPCQKCPNFLN